MAGQGALSAVSAALCLDLNHVVGVTLGSPLEAVVVVDGVLLTAVVLMMASAIDRRLFWIAGIGAATTLWAAAQPSFVLHLGAIGAFLCFVTATFLWYERDG